VIIKQNNNPILKKMLFLKSTAVFAALLSVARVEAGNVRTSRRVSNTLLAGFEPLTDVSDHVSCLAVMGALR
jgi:hypothetical protein